MGIVQLNTTMSFDGFTAGNGGEMDWVFEQQWDAATPVIEAVIRSTGAILAGRSTYEVGERAARPELRKPFGGAWNGPQFVLTHRPPPAEHDRDVTFLSGDIGAAVTTATDAAQGRNVLILGATVARQCLDQNLLDEILILMVPLILGEGVRLFERMSRRIKLEPITVREAGGITVLRFRVVG